MNVRSLEGGSFEDDFFPFSLTRSVADIRCGILTIREKWDYFPDQRPAATGPISLPANLIPDAALVQRITMAGGGFEPGRKLEKLTDILALNATEIENDFRLITANRNSEPVSATNKVMGSRIFLEPGAVVEHCYLNATDGPIYIGKDCLIMEGTMIRGPFAIGHNSIVKMGAKIYGATSAGPHCVLGGEIKNCVIFGYSNKAHDGYLGDSVIGNWCNLGGGTSNSNLKNSVGTVRLWNPLKKKYLDAGVKCGMMMGDYSRTAINTSVTTGAVIGVSCHLFGNGASPSYLPSFSWGFDQEPYAFEKALEHIGKWKKLKGQVLTNEEADQLKTIFDQQEQLS